MEWQQGGSSLEKGLNFFPFPELSVPDRARVNIIHEREKVIAEIKFESTSSIAQNHAELHSLVQIF